MTQIKNELIYEILKKLQAGQAEIRAILLDHSRPGDDLRRDKDGEPMRSIAGPLGTEAHDSLQQAQMDARRQHIEREIAVLELPRRDCTLSGKR
jgi:hypothetical protein